MYTDDEKGTEVLDAEIVDKAIELLVNGHQLEARKILEEVVKNTPKDYRHQYEKDGQLFIKFWDLTEFMRYVEIYKDELEVSINWVLNAYPRAFYLLGCLSVQQKNYDEAIKYLEAANRLEPNNPTILLETAVAYSAIGDHETALSLYERVPELGPLVTEGDKATALRGQGVQLIDLGQLESAEEALKESLKYDPNNRIAHGELDYIADLRSGGSKKTITTTDMYENNVEDASTEADSGGPGGMSESILPWPEDLQCACGVSLKPAIHCCNPNEPIDIDGFKDQLGPDFLLKPPCCGFPLDGFRCDECGCVYTWVIGVVNTVSA